VRSATAKKTGKIGRENFLTDAVDDLGRKIAEGATFRADSTEECAGICTETNGCLAYEWSENGSTCKLGVSRDPVTTNYGTILFCALEAPNTRAARSVHIKTRVARSTTDARCLDGFEARSGLVAFGEDTIETVDLGSAEECGLLCDENGSCMSYQAYDLAGAGASSGVFSCRLFAESDLPCSWITTDFWTVCDRAD